MKQMKKVFGGLLIAMILTVSLAYPNKAEAATPKDLLGTWYSYSDKFTSVQKLETKKITTWRLDRKGKLVPDSKGIYTPRNKLYVTKDKGKTYTMGDYLTIKDLNYTTDNGKTYTQIPGNPAKLWPSIMTIHGKKTKVLVSLGGVEGHFSVSLPSQSKVDYSFYYTKADYTKFLGKKDLRNANKTATLKVNTLTAEGKKLTGLKNKKVRVTARYPQINPKTKKEQMANLITFKVGKTQYDAWVFDNLLK